MLKNFIAIILPAISIGAAITYVIVRIGNLANKELRKRTVLKVPGNPQDSFVRPNKPLKLLIRLLDKIDNLIISAKKTKDLSRIKEVVTMPVFNKIQDEVFYSTGDVIGVDSFRERNWTVVDNSSPNELVIRKDTRYRTHKIGSIQMPMGKPASEIWTVVQNRHGSILLKGVV